MIEVHVQSIFSTKWPVSGHFVKGPIHQKLKTVRTERYCNTISSTLTSQVEKKSLSARVKKKKKKMLEPLHQYVQLKAEELNWTHWTY